MTNPTMNLKDKFREYAVQAGSVEDFILGYYKADRLNSVEGRLARIVADRESDVAKYGFAFISRFDSVTGRTVSYFG